MTEYDYSPEAYERYMGTQRRIAHWVDDTHQQPLSNPFVPSTRGSVAGHGSVHNGGESVARSGRTTRRSASISHPHSQAHSRHGFVAPSSRRPDMERTYSAPHTRSTRRSHPPSIQAPSSRQSRSSSYDYSSGTSESHTVPYTTIHPDPYNPTYIPQSTAQPIVVPLDGGRSGYMIVPPRGRHLEVVTPRYVSPEPQPPKPFFRRLLGGFSSGGSQKSGRSRSSRR